MNYLAEGVGTFLLVAVVVGSGIMGENMSNGNNGVALLANTIATGAILYVIINMFSSISGAHFNPVVSFIFYIKREISFKNFVLYSVFQVISGLLAIVLIHYIFQINIFQISTNVRGELPLLVSEIIATSGLIMTILFVSDNNKESIASSVALFITAGYWFTSSTSFANPAVTISRIFTNTFTGISPESVPYFLSGQLLGSILGLYIYNHRELFFQK